MLILSAVHSYLEKGISSRLSILLLCFRFQHVKDRFRDSESLRAEHRGNDPRNWPLYFQCPCRHIRHNLYMIHKQSVDKEQSKSTRGHRTSEKKKFHTLSFRIPNNIDTLLFIFKALQKGGVPAAPSGTATLLRLSPNHQFRPRPTLAETDFRHPRLSWLDGRCVQGPGTYSPRHG